MSAGRPTLLTDEIKSKILEAIRSGNYRSVAAKYAGVGVRTLHEWMQRGVEEPEGIYHDFRIAVIEAEKEAEILAVEKVLKAGAEDAKHLQWWLSCKYPERWSRDRQRLKELEQEVAKLQALLDEQTKKTTS